MNNSTKSLRGGLLKILDKQYLPDAEALHLIPQIYQSQPEILMGLIYIYNYGRIRGIQAERERKKNNGYQFKNYSR